MSVIVFLAFCILCFDFLLYVLFQWVYGEKCRKHTRRVSARAEKRRATSGNDGEATKIVPSPERAIHYRSGYFQSPPREHQGHTRIL